MPSTYALGNWTVSDRQDRSLKRLFNKMNKDLIDAAIADGSIINAGGTGYNVGNVLTLVDSGTTVRPATFTVTAVNSGVVTGVSLLDKGNYTSHQGAANHSTTVAPAGGTGCILRINFYADVPNMCVRNGGILDGAATSYAAQLDAEIASTLTAAIPGATTNQQTSAATALNVTLPD